MRILAAAMVLASTLASPATAQPLPPPPGTLVDAGGHKLHVHCTGAGSPTVILESGASSFAIDWALVQPEVSRTNRVSFVLVGQSMGGRFVRLFARRYPAEVAGMVLVDAEHEDGLFMGVGGKPVAISTLSDAEFDAAYQPPSGPPPAMPTATLQPAHLRLPADLQPLRLLLESRLLESIRTATPDAIVATMRSEHGALATLHRIDTSEGHPLGDLPLIVLSRGLNTGPRLRAWQADLARLSARSRQIVVDDSDHEIHLFRPDVVIQAIRDVQKYK